MNTVFVDTSGWFAILVPADPDHDRAKNWFHQNTSPLVVTDFVVDELLTLLRFRNEHACALQIGNDLMSESIAEVEWVTPADFYEAWHLFCKFTDKGWSFTDCVSYVVMSRLSINQAVAFDEHFRQFGTVSVLP